MFPLPSLKHLVQKTGAVSEVTEKSAFLQKLFSEKFGKVLTDQNANVLFEIFPLNRGGSLKFTLYD
jgi:hypothetical protein